jgi:hypothetical protein
MRRGYVRRWPMRSQHRDVLNLQSFIPSSDAGFRMAAAIFVRGTISLKPSRTRVGRGGNGGPCTGETNPNLVRLWTSTTTEPGTGIQLSARTRSYEKSITRRRGPRSTHFQVLTSIYDEISVFDIENDASICMLMEMDNLLVSLWWLQPTVDHHCMIKWNTT